MTPEQRHNGEDVAILKARDEVYLKARIRNPNRWSGDTRKWEPVGEVYLNPEKQKMVEKQNKAA